MPKTRGTYTAKRDGLTYDYEVSWRGDGRYIVWAAKVRLNNELIGLPGAQLTCQAGMDPVRAVLQDVESAIERRLSAD